MTRPRPTDALLFFCEADGKLDYHDSREPLTVPKGGLCFIPRGETYTWTFFDDCESSISSFQWEL